MTKVASGINSVQKTRDAVYQYDNDLESAIKFKTENPFRHELCSNNDNSDLSSEEE